jgi:hypothetical protein
MLREYLDSGRSVDAFLQQHPTVTRAQAGAILAIGFAAALTQWRRIVRGVATSRPIRGAIAEHVVVATPADRYLTLRAASE